LLTRYGKPGCMVGENYDMNKEFAEVEQRQLPTTLIAFRNNHIRFDEMFIGSGFEDNDFCRQFGREYPNGKFVICNRVKVIHLNEMKNQKGRYWEVNKNYFLKKWPEEPNRWE